jgi:hypothetical protein
MESRVEQERRWLGEMERLGPDVVRARLRDQKPLTVEPPCPDATFVEVWLNKKERCIRVRLIAIMILGIAIIALWLASKAWVRF